MSVWWPHLLKCVLQTLKKYVYWQKYRYQNVELPKISIAISTKTWLNCAETDEPKFDIEFVGCWKITAQRNSWLWKQNCECVIAALNIVASWPHSLLCADATGSPSRCCAGVTRGILLEKTPWQTPVSLGSRSSHPRLQLIWSVIYQSGDCGAKKYLLGGVDSESASESSV